MLDGWLPQSKVGNIIFVILFIILFILALSGCCLFRHAPTSPSVSGLPTITNTIIKTVKVNDWLVTGSILLVGVGVFGFLNGWKQGISLVAAASAVLGVSLVLKAYGAILVFAGAICIAGFVGWGIWIRVRALCEVVGNVEQSKARMAENETNKTVASGVGVLKSNLLNQSPTTKTLVAGIRKKINGEAK